MTMATVWSNELELKFLECYQEESILWDAKHPMYKDKNSNNKAWTRISSFMGISVQDLKRKRDSLLSSYRKYKKLIKDSIHPGVDPSDIYKPVWFAYDFIDSFLGEGQTCRIRNKTDRAEDPLHESEDDDKPNPPLPRTSHNIETQAKNRRRNPSELDQAGTYIKEAIKTLNTALVKKDSQSENCDLYGKIIANKLRKLSEFEQAEIMYEIDGIFLRRLTNTAQSPYDPSPCNSPGTCGTVKRPLSSESSYSEHIPQETVYHSNTLTSNEAPEIKSESITFDNRSDVIDSSNTKPRIQTKKIKRDH